MYKLTKLQKQNLKHLRDFMVKADPEGLDMGVYYSKKDSDGDFVENLDLSSLIKESQKLDLPNNQPVHTCGASMCLIGWSASVPALYSQIPFTKKGEVNMEWYHLAEMLYGVNDTNDRTGEYLFTADWAENEDTNTLEHAIHRLDTVLAAETDDDYEAISDELEEMEDRIYG